MLSTLLFAFHDQAARDIHAADLLKNLGSAVDVRSSVAFSARHTIYGIYEMR